MDKDTLPSVEQYRLAAQFFLTSEGPSNLFSAGACWHLGTQSKAMLAAVYIGAAAQLFNGNSKGKQ